MTRRVLYVQRHVNGPRVWVAGQRVHHGASGLIGAAAMLGCKRRRVAAVLACWALTDWHDVRVWFRREGLPAGELVSALTDALDDELALVYLLPIPTRRFT